MTDATSGEAVVVEATTYSLTHETRDCASLHFDTNNPRYFDKADLALAEGKTFTEKNLEDFLWKEERETTLDLYRSVTKHGGLLVPLIIDGRNLVREGNRRLAVLREISAKLDRFKPEKLPEELKSFPRNYLSKVPCKVLPAEMRERHIAIYIGQIHVGGKKEWKAYNQAKYLFDMLDQYSLKVNELAQLLGMSKPTVVRKMAAYEWTREYLKGGFKTPPALRGETDVFSHWEELYKVKAPMKKVGIDLEIETDREMVSKWIEGGKFNDQHARDARVLAGILEKDDARKRFESSGVKEAKVVLEHTSPWYRNEQFRKIREAQEAIDNLPNEEVQRIRPGSEEARLLLDLDGKIIRTLKTCGVQIPR